MVIAKLSNDQSKTNQVKTTSEDLESLASKPPDVAGETEAMGDDQLKVKRDKL